VQVVYKRRLSKSLSRHRFMSQLRFQQILISHDNTDRSVTQPLVDRKDVSSAAY
jgi:hypothetical protein